MRKIFMFLSVALFAALVLSPVAAQALPNTYREYKERYSRVATTPEGGVQMYFEALFAYLDPSRRAEASKMLRYSVASEIPLEQSSNYRTFYNRLNDPSMHYIFRSFCAGTSPENDYAMSYDNFRVLMSGKRQDGQNVKIFLRSTGADSPRSVELQNFDGLWHVVNNASTYVQVRPPKSELRKRHQRFDADFDMADTPSPQAAPDKGRTRPDRPTQSRPSTRGESTSSPQPSTPQSGEQPLTSW